MIFLTHLQPAFSKWWKTKIS